MALLKGSFVLMICQKITKMPITLNIPDRWVALRVGSIFTMKEWGTECYPSPEESPGESHGREKAFVSAAPPVFDAAPGPIIVSLA